MILALVLPWDGPVVLPPEPAPYASGMATYYAPGLMEQVYANRLLWGHVKPCQECVGLVAMLDREDVGRKVWLRYNGQIYGPFLDVDCANPKDLEWLARHHRVVEVSGEQAQAWGMVGPVFMEVYMETIQ